MTATALLLAALGFGLAYVNGANDVSKGHRDSRRHRSFGLPPRDPVGHGLDGDWRAARRNPRQSDGDDLRQWPPRAGHYADAHGWRGTLVGAAAWVLIATRTGLPVSTTHAIVGSLVGVAATAYGVDGVRWSALGSKIVMPLLLAPMLSMALVVLLLKVTKRFAGSATAPMPDCLCADAESAEPALAGLHSSSFAPVGVVTLRIVVGTQQGCAVERPQAARLTLDHLHWFTAGAASFARGMNDAPKIVALILAASALQGAATLRLPLLFVLVTTGMVLGSLVAGRRVTRVLAEKVTPMDHREGFLANLVTAGLVTAGATLGLPMSTTHVSSGGIIGAGTLRSSLNLKTLREIVLAWFITVPAAAALGIGAFLVARWLT